MGVAGPAAHIALVDAAEGVDPGLLRRPDRVAWLAPAVGLATTGLYAGSSLYRLWSMRAGVDLAILGEAVRRYASGQLPWSNLKAVQGFNLLGDHFSPVLALAAPA